MSRQPIGLHAPTHRQDGQDPLEGSPDDTEYLNAGSVITIAGFGSSLLDWAHDTGGVLLDLSDTSRPAVLISGRYAVMINAIVGSATWDANGYWQVILNVQSGSYTYVAEPIGVPTATASVGIPICHSVTLWMNAGDNIQVTASNRDSHSHDFNMFGPAISLLT